MGANDAQDAVNAANALCELCELLCYALDMLMLMIRCGSRHIGWVV